jgi:hypothetical protein
MLFRRMCGLDLELGDGQQFVGANIVLYDQCDFNFQFYTLRQYQRLFPNLTHLVLASLPEMAIFNPDSQLMQAMNDGNVHVSVPQRFWINKYGKQRPNFPAHLANQPALLPDATYQRWVRTITSQKY